MKLLPLLSAPLVSTSIHDTDKILDYTTNPDVLLEKWDSQIDLMLSDGFGRNIPSTVIDLTKNPFKLLGRVWVKILYDFKYIPLSFCNFKCTCSVNVKL